MSDELIGKKIGGYEILSRVGRGGMATVYCATQTSMNRTVAIKVLPRELMNDPAYKQRFEREAYIVSQLEHRNIVPVFDYGEYEGQPYIVMRYMNAGSIDDLLANGPLDIERILDIMEQIAPALDYAHNKNVLHRDLKPSNILLDDDDGAYVTDFGIARILGTEGQGNTITTQGVVGTPSYMSPEQAQGQPLDGRSDVYSLGVMLFEMATGRRPFQSDTPYSIAVMQVTTPPPSARVINPKVTEAVEQVIYKSMKKKPQDRYQTSTELTEALRIAIERPGKFAMLDTQPHPIFSPPEVPQVTQPRPAAQNAPSSAVPSSPYIPQSLPPSYTPRTPQPSRAIPHVRRKKEGGMWMWAVLGAIIGCALLALLVVGLLMLAEPYINTSDAGLTPDNIVVDNTAATDTIITGATNRTATAVRPTPQPALTLIADVGTRNWADDGRLIYFAERDSAFNVFRLNLFSKSEMQLTVENNANTFPMVSPDGRRIVFQSNRDGDHDIYTMNTAGGSLQKVMDNNVTDTMPSWSPDGEWIVFSSDTRSDGNYDLFIVRPDGSDLRRILTNGKRNSNPRWSPDRSQIVFTSGYASDARTWEITLLELTTEKTTALTSNKQRDAWAIFGLDGQRVYYISGSDGKTAVVEQSLNADAEPQTLYESDHFVWGLNLSPDGMFMAFNEGGIEHPTGSITLLRVDGSDHRVVAAEGGVYASWLP